MGNKVIDLIGVELVEYSQVVDGIEVVLPLFVFEKVANLLNDVLEVHVLVVVGEIVIGCVWGGLLVALVVAIIGIITVFVVLVLDEMLGRVLLLVILLLIVVVLAKHILLELVAAVVLLEVLLLLELLVLVLLLLIEHVVLLVVVVGVLLEAWVLILVKHLKWVWIVKDVGGLGI